MPNLEPVVIEGREYTIRHIGPESTSADGYIPGIWPQPSLKVQTFVVLNRPAMIARPLPMSNNPNSPDMVSGSWTGRLGDAGEFVLSFPNKEASDGQAWRNRFDCNDKNQWIEIFGNGEIESCCCIEKVDKKRDQIVISGHDGMFQTKGAYERDWTTVQAPRDVIERGTQVWVPVASDDFSYDGTTTPANPPWSTVGVANGGTAAILTSGGLKLSVTTTVLSLANVSTSALAVPTGTQSWTSTVFVQNSTLVTGQYGTLQLAVGESSGDSYSVNVESNGTEFFAALQFGNTEVARLQITPATSYGLLLESDGRWIWGFVNGQLVGCIQRNSSTTTTLLTQIALATGGTTAASVVVTGALTEALQPFLMSRGGSTDKGDYALPSITTFVAGVVSTYPPGGLHARYFNDLDLQGDANRLLKIQSPNRTQAFAGSGTSEYQNRQDATVDTVQNPTPGAATAGWSSVYFGAIYLKLSAGDYSFKIGKGTAANQAVRVWIGKTNFGDQIVDDWAFNANVNNFTLTASSLAGTRSYGGGTVIRDGWYPIKIEFAVDSTPSAGPHLFFTNVPIGYTDPGGTVIAIGAQTTTVPATSLSPLGMVDQRFQGISHFDMAQKTALAFGYQIAVEPKQLESGQFPGVMAPRFLEGQSYDTILEPDDQMRTEGLLNYGNVEDATDMAVSLFGNGAGFQSGNTGQLQARVFDHTHLGHSLFDIQAWQDFSDASFISLLQASLNSQLGLRLEPWQIVTGDPIGRARLANTWPLPSALKKLLWRPGDSLRIRARDIGVEDTTPRQLLVVTRSIHPNGVTATNVNFASRPRSHELTLKQSMFQATRPQRNYQRQLVTITGNWVGGTIASGTTGGLSLVIPMVTDQIVSIRLRVTDNTGGVSFNININGVDQTSTLNGPWTRVPLNLDIKPVAQPSAQGYIYAAIINNSGVTSSVFNYQLLVDVLR